MQQAEDAWAAEEEAAWGPLNASLVLATVGGEAVVVLNQELRYHHPSGLGLVGFYDVGNVFATVDSMRFDLRHTLGTGLRWASPVGLLRVDVGFPVDRQPEEKSYRIFFGLGQAF